MRESTKKNLIAWLFIALAAIGIVNGAFTLKSNIDAKKAEAELEQEDNA